MEGEQLIRTWLAAVDRVPAKEYRPAAGFEDLPDDVQGSSTMWSERFFAPAASPHAATSQARRSYHLSTDTSPDLLRHQYRFGQLALDVVESRNFTLIRTGRTLPVTAAAAREAARSILNLKDGEHQWTLQAPNALAEGAWFSSNPDADPMTMSWADRADGGIHGGALVFLCFKKDQQRVGYPDIRKWFDSAFRSR
jgi:hypothetical protein